MGNVFSIPPPEPTRLSLKLELTISTSETMPDFNNLFQEVVPKMMRVTDDLHRMVDYNRDLQNMMIGLLTIIGILIFFILKYRNGKQKRRCRSNRGKYRFNDIRSEHSSIGNRYMNENSNAFMSKVHLFDDVLICGKCRFRTNDINEIADHKSRDCSKITKPPSKPESIQCFTCENTFESSWKLLQHLTEKHNLNLYRDASITDDCQERRGPQTPSPLPSESVKSEQNCTTRLIMNDDHTCIPNLRLDIPMPTTPTSMPYYSDPIAAAYGTPPLNTSVSTAATGTPSVSSLINSEDPCMFKGRVFVGNLKKTRVSREDLVGLFKCCGNVLGATLFKGYAIIQFSSQTEAELSVQTLNGYTWEGSELVVKILTLYSKNDATVSLINGSTIQIKNYTGAGIGHYGDVYIGCYRP